MFHCHIETFQLLAPLFEPRPGWTRGDLNGILSLAELCHTQKNWTRNEKRKMKIENWKTKNEKQKMKNEKWKIKNEKLKITNKKQRKMKN